MSGQAALVTGGAGFIGSHLVRRLLSEGYRVRVVDDLSTGNIDNLAEVRGEVEFVEADIRDLAALEKASIGIECIWHQAAMASVPRSIAEPGLTHAVNDVGTHNVLLAAKKSEVPRVVMASSSSVYGDTVKLPKSEDIVPDPISPYAAHKLTNEIYARQFHLHYGMVTVCLRYFNVFGPRQDPSSAYAAVLPCFVSRIQSGQPPVVNGDGSHSRDFTYVANAVEANFLAGKAEGVGGEAFNVATGHRVTIKQLAEKVVEAMGWQGGIEYGPERSGDILHSYADISKAERMLGYRPVVSFEEGLEKTLEWFLK
jgi:UDP-glucose 4-epimerase